MQRNWGQYKLGAKSQPPPRSNLTKSQSIALRELKKDRDCIVLTADKGLAMVIMDRQDYIKKANTLLNQNTYRSIPQDPTNTIKNKLINDDGRPLMHMCMHIVSEMSNAPVHMI